MNQVQQFFEYIFNALKVFIVVQPWESGLRVRNGKHVKKLSKGIYFRIPYFDSTYIQESRLRVADMAMQTITTKDQKTISLNSSLGYTISDVEKLYQTLFHPETTLRNIASGEIAEYVYSKNLEEINPRKLEEVVLKKLKETSYGVNFEYFKLSNFAVVRTFRLIQDQTWSYEGLEMSDKR